MFPPHFLKHLYLCSILHLFHYLPPSFLCSTLQLCLYHEPNLLGFNTCSFSSNTLRLWYPQLAAMIGSDGTVSLCSAIAPPPTDVVDEVCTPIETDMLTYLQSTIVGAGSVLTYGIGGALVNKYVLIFLSILSYFYLSL